MPRQGSIELHSRLQMPTSTASCWTSSGELFGFAWLYGHMGYECVLAKATRATRQLIGTRRAVVDFAAAGIRSVSDWS